MKSMKLASGFAVSALALAIAGQTVAQETTTDVSFTGSVKAETTFDLENGTRYNSLPGYTSAGATEDWYHLEATWAVSHGPFSGDLMVGLEADDGKSSGDADVRVDNLVVEEGPISFGQIGSVAATADVLEDLTDFGSMNAADESTLDFGVDGGVRYTVSDLGLKVQAEGDEQSTATDAPFGLAAGIEQDLDVATVWADAQYREVADLSGNEQGEGETAFGAAVEASPIDLVTLTAVFRNKSTGDGSTGYAAKADLALTDTVSAYGQYASVDDQGTENTAFMVGGEAMVDMLTVSGSYEAESDAVGDGVLSADASYDAGIVVAYVESEFELENSGTELVFGATHTTDSGIEYNGEYTNRNEDHSDGVGSMVTASAGYSF